MFGQSEMESHNPGAVSNYQNVFIPDVGRTFIQSIIYNLQLTNEKADQKVDKLAFIEGSTLTSFGFCSILL